ncbi:hypothetical protein KY330_03610 [Candidatus Woesearchaeota archaeon]|nr:hypothetical protein [Candidatus Woesearchaeota archaeon]
MEENIIIGIAVFFIAYFIFRYLMLKRLKPVINYNQEILNVLNNEDNKVRGRFE